MNARVPTAAAAWVLGCFLVLNVSLAGAGEDLRREFRAGDWPGSKDRQYIVHLPDGYQPGRRWPLVMVLHGCKQNHETIQRESRFDPVADREGFIVVYPFITRYDGLRETNCWGFWFANEIHAGAGEVEDLWAVIEAVGAEFSVDPERIHVTGLSSGGAMAVVVMVAHSERIASGASTAGLPYAETAASVPRRCNATGSLRGPAASAAAMDAEMAAGKREVPIFIVHSENDCTVNIQAARDMRDAWGRAFSANTLTPVFRYSGVTKGTPWTRERYDGNEGRSLVETLFLERLTHGWYGGADGQFAFADAPDTASLMWEFFASHPLSANQAPTLSIDASVVEGDCLALTGSASDPEGVVSRVDVALDGVNPRAPEPANLGGPAWSWRGCGLSLDTRYVPVVTASDERGAESTVRGESVSIGDPPADQAPVLQLDEAREEGRCIRLAGLAVDDMPGLEVFALIGDQWLPATLVGESWRAERCALAAGVYATGARAVDSAGQASEVGGPQLTLVVTYEREVSSDLSGHVAAQRVRLYRGGFGAADRSYNEMLAAYGVSERFSLYLVAGDWYSDPARITGSPPDGPAACRANTTSTYAHVTAGRAELCGFWQACAVGSGDRLGAWSTVNVVTLAETAPGRFEAGACP
jgi:poly(hydroxyalkanoate) depolymerase family esterase